MSVSPDAYVTVAAAPGPSPAPGATEVVPGKALPIDTKGNQYAALVVANSNGGFWTLAQTKNGALSVSESLDGNSITLGGFVLLPGRDPSPTNLNSYKWGDVLQCYVVNTLIYDLRSHQAAGVDFATWLNQTWPGALIGTLELQLPSPALVIKDLGPVSLGSSTHNIEIDYYEHFSGEALDAVSNPVNFLVTSAGDGGTGPYTVSGGKATVQVTGPFSFLAYIGAIYASGAPFTPNTIVSNDLTI